MTISLSNVIVVQGDKSSELRKVNEVKEMSEEQKKQAESLTRELDKLPKDAREKVLIFAQGMVAMAGEKKE